ncbi:hypothetical protein [Gilvimarinus polysaccharolyticus]|uniref:hypothetical protein n=1 Tax=Gilvimarinus polysaccharolyticus TaxID=863921 RepID=UPI0006736978|nr:hypothetical protein [Gilvimarinus polysaccharolyticus]
MSPESARERIFGLQLSSVPLVNLRIDFYRSYKFLYSKAAGDALTPPRLEPIEYDYFTWYGMPNDFFTLISQRAILGLESYVPGTLFFLSHDVRGRDDKYLEKLKNPFSFGGRSIVKNLYDTAPGDIDPSFSLLIRNQSLYQEAQKMYREVRNPLFHGGQLTDLNIISIQGLFNHIAQLYVWVDSIYDPEKIVNGLSHYKVSPV